VPVHDGAAGPGRRAGRSEVAVDDAQLGLVVADTELGVGRASVRPRPRRDWSGADLASRLGVTTRTVRNDIERLRILGYEVHSSTGITGGYRLGAGSAMPPLLLDDDEAVAGIGR
jgi:biotin operon repressor